RLDRETQPAEASRELLEALKISPETEADTLLAATLAEQSGEYDAAEKAYRRLLEKNPKSAPATAGLVHLLIARREFPEAETMLRTALDQAPGDPALTAQLAAVLAAQNKGEALPLLEELHKSHPGDLAITRMLAEIRSEAGDTAGADGLTVELLKRNPDDAALLVAHGQNLIRQLKYQEALGVFDRATRANPASGDAWAGLAFAASKTGHPDLTLHALTERSKYQQEVPATYFLWATAYDALHNKEQAAVYYHHFLDVAGGKFPDQEWQARQRLILLEKKSGDKR
ncbi:MAG: tetratricopeptide repeat protein, partial [Terracidiphilus sp.]